MMIRFIIFISIILSPIFLFGQIQDNLEHVEQSKYPNSLGFYKVILDKPIKLEKFERWLRKNKKYHIVYYNKYEKLIAGANQTLVSRVGFLHKTDASRNLIDSYIKEQDFIKKYMISDFEDVEAFRADIEEKERLALEIAERQRKKLEIRRKAEKKEAEEQQKKASMGLHCINAEEVKCSNGKYTFNISNTCELPFRIKYSYLVGFKKVEINILTVPPQKNIKLESCPAIHSSFYYVSHSDNPFMFGKITDEKLALEHLIREYEDVYLCRKCEGQGALSCRQCGGDGYKEGQGIRCTHCSARGSNTCYNCKGKGVFGLD